MSVTTIKDRLAEIMESVEGVRRAYARGPFSLPVGDLPIAVPFTGPSTADWKTMGADFDVSNRLYLVRLYVMPSGQGIDAEAEEKCEPFFERVWEIFGSRPALGLGAIDTQLPGVDALLLGDQGVSRLIYANEEFFGIEFRLQVAETFRRTYAAGE